MIFGTVALPIWNSKEIAWLCLESLCRQNKPENGWELIVFEEVHPTAVGESFIRSYEERLRGVGCEKINYMTTYERLPLSQKWVYIAKAAVDDSKYFCLCAADNYYHPWMLQDAEKQIGEADWCVQTRGYFYDFSLDLVTEYFYPVMGIGKEVIINSKPFVVGPLVGLQMYASTPMVKRFPLVDVWRGVDSWFSIQMQIYSIAKNGKDGFLKCFVDGSDHHENTLCTNGYNNISTGRVNFFKEMRKPFYATEKKLEEIVPEDIYKRIYGMDKLRKEEAEPGSDNSQRSVSRDISRSPLAETT